MSQVLQEVLQANQRYADTFGDKASLTLPPARARSGSARPTPFRLETRGMHH